MKKLKNRSRELLKRVSRGSLKSFFESTSSPQTMPSDCGADGISTAPTATNITRAGGISYALPAIVRSASSASVTSDTLTKAKSTMRDSERVAPTAGPTDGPCGKSTGKSFQERAARQMDLEEASGGVGGVTTWTASSRGARRGSDATQNSHEEFQEFFEKRRREWPADSDVEDKPKRRIMQLPNYKVEAEKAPPGSPGEQRNSGRSPRIRPAIPQVVLNTEVEARRTLIEEQVQLQLGIPVSPQYVKDNMKDGRNPW